MGNAIEKLMRKTSMGLPSWKFQLHIFWLNMEIFNLKFSTSCFFQLDLSQKFKWAVYPYDIDLLWDWKNDLRQSFSWFASAVYWVESAHSCSVTFFECHYDTNDYWGTGCGYLKKIIFASFKNGNICDQTIQFIFWRTFFGSGLK